MWSCLRCRLAKNCLLRAWLHEPVAGTKPRSHPDWLVNFSRPYPSWTPQPVRSFCAHMAKSRAQRGTSSPCQCPEALLRAWRWQVAFFRQAAAFSPKVMVHVLTGTNGLQALVPVPVHEPSLELDVVQAILASALVEPCYKFFKTKAPKSASGPY